MNSITLKRGGSTTMPPPTTENTNVQKSLSTTIRQAIFPIYGPEVNKFIKIGFIKFFVIFVLTLTRDTKDTMIVTQSGAEAIAFLKV
jgi:AAA family ATP:ADP antiporter